VSLFPFIKTKVNDSVWQVLQDSVLLEITNDKPSHDDQARNFVHSTLIPKQLALLANEISRKSDLFFDYDQGIFQKVEDICKTLLLAMFAVPLEQHFKRFKLAQRLKFFAENLSKEGGKKSLQYISFDHPHQVAIAQLKMENEVTSTLASFLPEPEEKE